MGIFDLFKKKAITQSLEKENSNFIDVEILFEIPLNERNKSWIQEFNKSIKNYYFDEIIPPTFEDKSGMNYLNLTLSKQSTTKIDEFIKVSIQKGVGISINGNENEKKFDWLFTYGEILDYYLNGEFYSNKISEPFTGIVVDTKIHNKEVTIGQPSERFFPEVARIQIKKLLESFGLEEIKIALIWWRESNRITLAFEIIPEMFQNPTHDSLQILLKFIGWFLPNHYDTIFIKGNEEFKIL